jgi:ferredoxin-type protein NapH
MKFGPYRKASQIAAFALMFVIPVLNIFEIYAITGTYYAINVGGLGIADPVMILQTIFTTGSLTVPLLAAAIFPVLLALLFGRIWCGWMCPYLLLSDSVAWTRSKLRTVFFKADEPSRLPVAQSRKANVTRFIVLGGALAVSGAIGIPVINYISAPGIVSTEAMMFVKERIVSIEFAFIVVLVALEITILPRFWCRLFCPTGSFIGLFRTPYTVRVTTDVKNPKAPCCSDNYCTNACPMGLQPYREGGNLLCVNCGLCVDACPTNRLHFEGFTV